jgi:hypothetical protein
MMANVDYEIPYLRKQAAKYSQQITDGEKKHAEYLKSATTCAQNFKQVGTGPVWSPALVCTVVPDALAACRHATVYSHCAAGMDLGHTHIITGVTWLWCYRLYCFTLVRGISPPLI